MGSEQHPRLPGEIVKFKEDHSRNNVTIGSVLNLEKKSSRSGRTLLDIIHSDHATGDNNKAAAWKNFRGMLRHKRASSSMQPKDGSSSNNQMTRIPTSDPDIESESGKIRSSSSLRLHTSLSSLLNEQVADDDGRTPGAPEEQDDDEDENENENEGTMSLMSLLAEADREMGIDSTYSREDEADEGGEVEAEKDGDFNDCCVCMVRHKGSAFIPCGHTFCRLCSRELYVQRGNCPICNGYILEILDIFC